MSRPARTLREAARSLIRFTFALTRFGATQINHALSGSAGEPPARSPASSLEAVRSAAEENLDEIFRAAYRAGDHVQSGIVDIVSLAVEPDRLDPAGETKKAFGNPRDTARTAIDVSTSAAGRSTGFDPSRK